MSYQPLAARTGYLEGFDDLVTSRKVLAESAADSFVDGRLHKWDRVAWSGAAVPPDVARAALMHGSAHYILMSFGAANPDSEEPPLAKLLFDAAEAIVQQVLVNGYVIGPDGQKQYSTQGEDASSMNVRLER